MEKVGKLNNEMVHDTKSLGYKSVSKIEQMTSGDSILENNSLSIISIMDKLIPNSILVPILASVIIIK